MARIARESSTTSAFMIVSSCSRTGVASAGARQEVFLFIAPRRTRRTRGVPEAAGLRDLLVLVAEAFSQASQLGRHFRQLLRGALRAGRARRGVLGGLCHAQHAVADLGAALRRVAQAAADLGGGRDLLVDRARDRVG